MYPVIIALFLSLLSFLSADLLPADESVCASETLPDDTSVCEGEGDVSMTNASWATPTKSPQSEEEIKYVRRSHTFGNKFYYLACTSIKF